MNKIKWPFILIIIFANIIYIIYKNKGNVPAISVESKTKLISQKNSSHQKKQQIQKSVNLNNVQKNLKQNFTRSIPDKLSHGPYLKDIQDFTLKKNDFKTKVNINSPEFQSYAKSFLTETISCLKKDLCGMDIERDAEYFDPSSTHRQILLKRVLDFTLGENIQFPKDQLLHLVNDKNAELSTLAFQHLLINKMATEKELIQSISFLEENSRAKNITHLLKKKGPNLRNELIDEMARGIKELSPYSTITLLDEIKNVDFSPRELRDLAVEFCPFKERNDHNWIVLKYRLGLMLKKKDLVLDEVVCH